MRRVIWVLVVLFALAGRAEAACTPNGGGVWTTTPDRTSFASCASQAANGDTINVTSGSVTWTSEVLIDGKGLTIVGAGTGQTVIALGFNGALLRHIVGASQFADISGIQFVHNGIASSKPLIVMEISGPNNARIHHNHFSTPVSGSSQRGIAVKTNDALVGTVQFSMLIDHNLFSCGATSGSRCQAVEIDLCDGANVTDGTLLAPAHAAMSLPLNFGTQHFVFFEDNTLDYTRMQDGSAEGYGCARVVQRFNTYNGAGFGHHGTDSGQRRGTQAYEYIFNTINGPLTGTWSGRIAQIRSGNGFVAFNTYAAEVSGGVAYDYFRGNWTDGSGTMQVPAWAGECDGTHAWDGNTGSGTSYPGAGYRCLDAPGQYSSGVWPNITNAWGPNYAFRNLQGGVYHATGNGTQAHIGQNIDVFDEVAGFDGTSGVGFGLRSARPATCTLHTGYWSTDQGGDWHKTNGTANDGTFDLCSATNTWTNGYYTPYQYPHPLQGFSETPPAAPTALACTGGVQLADCTWTDNADDETGFVLERGLMSNCADCVTVANLGANTTARQDTGLQHETTYYYRVKAVNLAGSSSYSNIDDATTDMEPDIGAAPCTESYEASSGTDISCEVENVPAGALIWVAPGFLGAETVTGCTDTQSNVYTAAEAIVANGSRKVQVWWTPQNAQLAHVTITCAFSGAVTERGLGGGHATGLGSTPVIDDTASATGTSANPSAGAVTATVDDTHIVTAFASGSTTGTPTVDGSFAMIHDAASAYGAATQTTSVSGAYTATFTAGESAAWAAQAIIFRSVTGGELPDPRDEYFVDHDIACADSAAQPGSPAEPFCTVPYGVTRVASGNTLTVVPSATIYSGLFTVQPAQSGAPGASTVIRCAVARQCHIRGSGIHTGRISIGVNNGGFSNSPADYVRLEGFEISLANNCITVYGGEQVVLQNNHCHDIGQQAIHVRGNDAEGTNASNVSILDNEIHDTGQWMDLNGEGIYLGSGSTAPRDNTNTILVRGNVIYDVEDEGIELKSGTHHITVEENDVSAAGLDFVGSCGTAFGMGIEVGERDLGNQTWTGDPQHVIRNNRVHDIECSAIRLGTGSTAYNNLIWNVLTAGQDGIRITNPNAESFSRNVYHNTIALGTADAITESGSPTVDSQNNIGPATAGTNLAYDAGNHEDPTSGNFRLRSTASGAIDQGADLTGTVSTDIDGRSRAQGAAPDLGAHEFGIVRPRRLRIR